MYMGWGEMKWSHTVGHIGDTVFFPLGNLVYVSCSYLSHVMVEYNDFMAIGGAGRFFFPLSSFNGLGFSAVFLV